MRALTRPSSRSSGARHSKRRNEVLAREGIDTMLFFHLLALLDCSRNEVLAREGIDTKKSVKRINVTVLRVEMRY